MLFFSRKLLWYLPMILFLSGSAPNALQLAIQQLQNDQGLAPGFFAFHALTTDSGNVMGSHNSELAVIPASTMKIITTSAALGILGENFRYSTNISYTGKFDSLSGVLQGDVFIEGSGDPTLNSEYFNASNQPGISEQWSEILKAKGIRKITGRVIASTIGWSDNAIPDGWTWGDIGQYYGAGAYGIAWSDNKIKLYFNSSTDSVYLNSMKPADAGVSIVLKADVGGAKDNLLGYCAPYQSFCTMQGRLPANQMNFEVEIAHPDPALQCARDMRSALSASGITVTGVATTTRIATIPKLDSLRTVLHKHQSVPLRQIVKHINKKSDNVFAEQLLRTLGKSTGNEGSTENGVAAVLAFWKKKGVPIQQIHMTDGSGLSRSNLVTASALSQILRLCLQQKWNEAFETSLPVAGKEGSLTSLCKGTCAENNLHAKSGYINRARGYAGYVKTTSGKKVCFTLLANNYSCSPSDMKKKLEKILVKLAEQ